MRTILHAIVDAANCADRSKDSTPSLKGVVVEWVEMAESNCMPEDCIRCSATDGKILAVCFSDPGKVWPKHGKIIVQAEGVKQIKNLLKRTEEAMDSRPSDALVSGQIETWFSAVDSDGRPIAPFQVLRIDVKCAGEGVVVPLVKDFCAPNIEAVMRPRRLTMGTPAGRLHTDYVQRAQDAVGWFGPPTWYTDGRCAFLFNRADLDREHDFALVMPAVGDDEAREIYPWGRPKDAAPADQGEPARPEPEPEPEPEPAGLDEPASSKTMPDDPNGVF